MCGSGVQVKQIAFLSITDGLWSIDMVGVAFRVAKVWAAERMSTIANGSTTVSMLAALSEVGRLMGTLDW